MPALALFDGDGFNRLMGRLKWPERTLGRQFLIMCMIVLLYVVYPLALLYTTGARWQLDTFLEDYALWAQLLAMLALILAEGFVGRKMESTSSRLAEIVIQEDENEAEMKRVSARARRLSTTWAADVGVLLVAYTVSTFWLVSEVRSSFLTWRTAPSVAGVHLTAVGWWVEIVYMPLFHYIWMRWAWKAFVWTWFLCKTSRVRLQINVCHPDRAGGLAFLGDAQATWGILVFLYGIVDMTGVMHATKVDGASWKHFGVWGAILGFIVIGPVLFFAPLFAFRGQMHEAKESYLARFNKLAAACLEEFNAKCSSWTSPVNTESVRILGQRMSDLSTWYDHAAAMRMLPFGVKNAVSMLVSAAASQVVPFLLGLVP